MDYGYLLWSIFLLWLEATTRNLSQRFFSHCLGGHNIEQHLLAGFQWPELSDQQTLLLTEICLQCQKWSPLQGRGKEWFLGLFVLTKREMTQPVLAKVTATMCTAACTFTHPPSSIPSLFASAITTYLQNGLDQLIACSQNRMKSMLIISH